MNIKELKEMDYKTTTISIDKAIWEEYSQIVKKMKINKGYMNSVIIKNFIDEYKEEN